MIAVQHAVMMKMQTVNIASDGACSANGKEESFGGWGAIIELYGFEVEIYGGFAPATNNQAELLAVINSIEFLKKPSHVVLTTDSQYVIHGMTKYIEGWIKNGWINSRKEPVKNKELWQRLNSAIMNGGHVVDWTWVKGHDGHPLNERADQLARLGVEEIKINIR